MQDVEGENAERVSKLPSEASKDEYMAWKREQPWFKQKLRAVDEEPDEEAV